MNTPQCIETINNNYGDCGTRQLVVTGPMFLSFDLSVRKRIAISKVTYEFSLDIFNVLDTVQFTTVNSTANFRSLTDRTITNLPYDSQGNLVQRNGFGTISGVAPPRTLQLVARMTF